MADGEVTTPLTFSELVQACKNVGIDLECGRCAAQFFSGVVFPSDVHTCDPERDTRGQPRHATAREEQLLNLIVRRNRSITLIRDDLEDQRSLLQCLRRMFREVQDDLRRYGRHENGCDENRCTCGLTAALAKNPPSEEPSAAERIAQWILGYGNEPMDAALVAQAIRDGKWR